MFNTLQYKAHLSAARLRHSSPFYWLACNTSDLTFFTLLGLPLVTLGFLFRFAYTDHIQIESAKKRHTDLTCLARNIYFEARGEPMAGQYAVAEVTMNRVASRRFPATVCTVVHEARWDSIRKRYVGAFSWTEKDSLSRPKGIPWQRATVVAVAAYDNPDASSVSGALFYHAVRIDPSWSRTKKIVAEIGRHRFYE